MHALEKIIVYYNHCKENDIYKSVIENILKNLDKVKKANIYELADLCYTSTTTMSRLSRKMGYRGFADFKMSLVNCVRNYNSYNHFVPFSMLSSLEESKNGYFSIMRMLTDQIEKDIDMEQIKRINHLLHQSRKVCFFTCGNESVERHFQELLIIAGKESVVLGLPQQQMECLKNLNQESTVIYIAPITNESGDVEEVIEEIKATGAKIVLISDIKNSNLRGYADEYIGFDGAMCMVDDQAFNMIVTMMFMDYRKTYL